jgi:hypothetical protein
MQPQRSGFAAGYSRLIRPAGPWQLPEEAEGRGVLPRLRGSPPQLRLLGLTRMGITAHYYEKPLAFRVGELMS